LLYKRWVEKE